MKISFATLAIPPAWAQETLLLVESLRTFGGPFADAPVSVWTLPGRPLPTATAEKLRTQRAELHEFEMDAAARKFPLAVIPFGAAAAEAHHAQKDDILVWLLPDTLILQPPEAFHLPEGKRLGYRPVHHQNVGSPAENPPDTFWKQIYQHCEVPEAHIFPMQTCYRETVRPYFNAGILAVRPEDGLCQAWLETFRHTYSHPDFTPFYEQVKFAIFMHQAVLSGVILQKFTPSQLAELPENYNYPLHMHPDYPPAGQAAALEAITTARYESVGELPGFLKTVPVSDSLQKWLSELLPQ